MKCSVIIDKEKEEQVIIYAHQKTKLVEQIERLASEDILIGYRDSEAVRLLFSEVYCFIVEENKVYALTESERFRLKSRLYQLEEVMPPQFVKLHQSCIANMQKMRRFDASMTGALMVTMQNGYTDFVSRRNLKTVKERLGL